jgi:hypothetical protein
MRPYSRDDGRDVFIIRRLRDVFAPTAPPSGHPYRTRRRYGLLRDVGGSSANLWATEVYEPSPVAATSPPRNTHCQELFRVLPRPRTSLAVHKQ